MLLKQSSKNNALWYNMLIKHYSQLIIFVPEWTGKRRGLKFPVFASLCVSYLHLYLLSLLISSPSNIQWGSFHMTLYLLLFFYLGSASYSVGAYFVGLTCSVQLRCSWLNLKALIYSHGYSDSETWQITWHQWVKNVNGSVLRLVHSRNYSYE